MRTDSLRGIEASLNEAIDEFVTYRLVFDAKGDILVPGMVIAEGDYLLFNSGIKVNLPKDTAGIFFNKSGMGNKGYDTRACVVDEDYSGFVHLSVAFTKSVYFGQKLFCGDKIQQMVVLPVVKTELEEVEEGVYNELMSDSQRGADGFGSSDVKHEIEENVCDELMSDYHSDADEIASSDVKQ